MTAKPIYSPLSVAAPDMEQAVLGACLLSRHTFGDVATDLREGTFYDERHRLIFAAMFALHARGQAIDLLTLTEELRQKGKLDAAGGAYYLVDITNRVVSPANIEHHIRILQQYEIMREGARIGTELMTAASDVTQDPLDIVDKMQRDVYSLIDYIGGKKDLSVARVVTGEVRRTDRLLQSTGEIVGLPTGFTELDELLSGLQSPDLMIVAARPGMGKTALALTIGRHVINDGSPVGIFSLEMSAGQLVNRLASMESGINMQRIKNPRRMEEPELRAYYSAMERIADWPLFIDDTPGIDIHELRAKARRMVARHGVRVIFVDYLQLVTTREYRGQREQEVSAISRGLKGIAKELDVPVVALSQLSRAVEARGGMKRPQLSDLRESGAVEQDADIVAFVYRPEYYDIKEDQDGNSTRGIAEIIIAKHRNGPLGDVLLHFDGARTEFRNSPVADNAPF